MNAGKNVQLADPWTIYERPLDPFVADFIGSSNFFQGEALEAADGRVRVAVPGLPPLSAITPHTIRQGERVTVSVRPEGILLTERQAAAGFEGGPARPVGTPGGTSLGARH